MPQPSQPQPIQVIFFRRAEDKTRTLAAARRALGIDNQQVSIAFAPYGETEYSPASIPPRATGIMLTSQAALPNLPPTSLPIHCVGSATAKACKDAGFTVGVVGAGSARSLAKEIIAKGIQGVLYHPHGEQVNQSHYPLLEQAGIEVMPKCAYRVCKSKNLPPNIIGQAGVNALPLWCVFSSAAALHLETLLTQSGYNGKRQAVVLTPQVAAQLSHWDNVLVSQKPQLESLLTKVKTYLHEQQKQ